MRTRGYANPMPKEQSTPSRIAPLTLVAAAVASAVTTMVIARFGLAGTILGASLAPVLVALVAESVRRPAERVRSRTTSFIARPSRDEPRRLRLSFDRVSWRRVAAIGAVAFAGVVAAFTVFDLAGGESPVSERGTTFFTPSGGSPSGPAGDEPSERQPEQPAPAPPPATETPPPTTTEPPPTTTEPPPTETTTPD